MTTPWWLKPLIIEFSAVAVAFLALTDISSPVRVVLAFWFMAFCPGLAWVQLLRISDIWSEIVLSIVVSFALDVLVATTFVYLGHASPKLGLAILILITLVGLGMHLMGKTAAIPNATATPVAEE